MPQTHRISEESTLLEALCANYPESSKQSLRSWIQCGRVQVNGRTCKRALELVHPGETLFVSGKVKRLGGRIPIVYEDETLIVLNKPCGLLSVATDRGGKESVHSLLKEEYSGRIYVIHRLDLSTSGVIVFAKENETFVALKQALKQREVKRQYLAIVEGEMPSGTRGTWSSFLFEDRAFHVHTTKDANRGEKAVTHYRVVGRKKGVTSLEVNLETGKKNQIRVHCQEAGFPVLGDTKYGGTKRAKRLCLHAYRLEFFHPKKRKRIRCEAEIPGYFEKVMGGKILL